MRNIHDFIGVLDRIFFIFKSVSFGVSVHTYDEVIY
jgi:hypothetical protein